MAIPMTQLETWSHQGSITQSADTYKTIKDALESTTAPYRGKNYNVFLQGSYGNSTNIYAESDVDVVILFEDTYYTDLTALSAEDRVEYDKTIVVASYQYANFKKDVLKILTDAFNGDIAEGKKAITIAQKGNRRKADVLVAMQFRRYYKFKSPYDVSYETGICFYKSDGTQVVNYPKQHSENLTKKHQETNNLLKPMVRIFKNLRGKLVEDGLLKAGTAPSYYIEGLLYNVPTGEFGANYADTFINVLHWLNHGADKDNLVCANEQYYLLKDLYPDTCWNMQDAEAFIAAAEKMWKNWK